MEHVNITNEASVGLIKRHAYASGLLIIILPLAAAVFFLASRAKASRTPQSLRDPVPFIYNTIQFISDNSNFMKRVTIALKNANLAKFYLGTTPVYLVSGAQNMQTFFARSHKIGNEDIFVHNALPSLYKMNKEEVERFAKDNSGRQRVPAPGTENIAPERRYWLAYEHIHSEYVARTQYMQPIVDIFCRNMNTMLDDYPLGEWTTLSVTKFCKREVTECAMSTLFGPKVFELNPGFLDKFWHYDENVFALTLGFPRWMNSRPYKVQDQFLGMIEKYLDAAWANFDWTGPSAEAPWEPNFGARACREIVKWLRDDGFQGIAAAGALAVLVFAQNSNTIPTMTWALMEIVQDPSLFQAIREEVSTAYVTDPETGSRTIDPRKLVTLPLLQSVFIETLRLHMNFSLIRNVKEPVTMDGFTIPKGSMLQAPMPTAHCDEAVWGAEGHPASEFWAERHISYVDEKDDSGKVTRKRVFAMAGRPSSFFPFGGGLFICPGRHLAKNEILMTLGLIVSRFDVEFVEWTNLDGSPSDRPAENNPKYSGAGAMPPDRDVKIRWKRTN